MIVKAGQAIEFERSIVAAVHFEMQGVDAKLAAPSFHERQAALANSFAAMFRGDIELVDEYIDAKILKTVAESQDNITDRLLPN